MAFRNASLAVIAYENGFTLWHYQSTDAMDEILSAKYFFELRDLIHSGDIMLINAKDGTGFRCVTDNTHGEITWKTLS